MQYMILTWITVLIAYVRMECICLLCMSICFYKLLTLKKSFLKIMKESIYWQIECNDSVWQWLWLIWTISWRKVKQRDVVFQWSWFVWMVITEIILITYIRITIGMGFELPIDIPKRDVWFFEFLGHGTKAK